MNFSKLYIIVAFCFVGLNCIGQTIKPVSLEKKHQYMVKVIAMKGKNISGRLYETNDSAIVVLTDKYYYEYSQFDTTIIKYSAIKEIKAWRKNKIGKSLGISVLTGITLGYLLGHSGSDSPNTSGGSIALSRNETSALSATVCGIVAIPIGILIGSIKEHIFVDGSIQQFLIARKRLVEISQTK